MTDSKDVKADDGVSADLEKRAIAFNEELIPLLAKYKLGLGGQPIVNGTPVNSSPFLSARPQLFDDSKPKEEKAEGEAAPAQAPVGAGADISEG